jgi:hypothetical protein
LLHAQGLDQWVIDFGDPAAEPGGNDRTFSDHVLALVSAVRRVRQATGQDVRPVRNMRNDIDFLLALHDRESLLPREPQRKFLKSMQMRHASASRTPTKTDDGR